MLKEQFLNALYSDCAQQDGVSPKSSDVNLSTIHNQLKQKQSYLVAFSGGMDSHVLLHLCVQAQLNIRAVYINHGLQSDALEWQSHCHYVCEKHQVTFKTITVNAQALSRQSPEDAARKARYTALQQNLREGECLMTAHHQDDQAETFLLQLMRGAGTAGLASMPAVKPFGLGRHCRPLLHCSRDDITHYATDHNLQWVDDPSNLDTNFDRNFIRHQVMPFIQKRWREAHSLISQSADIQQENLELLEAMAEIDLASIITNDKHIISIKVLSNLSKTRQFNVLRYWINLCDFDKATRNVINEIQNTVITAMDDAKPLVRWGNTEIRRYQDNLYVMPALSEHDDKKVMLWNVKQTVKLEKLGLSLSVGKQVGAGISDNYLSSQIEVKFRQGGEKIKPAGHKHTTSLKKLMQQNHIPPWQRSRIPLLYIDGVLACVCGHWVADEYADKGENVWLPVIEPAY